MKKRFLNEYFITNTIGTKIVLKIVFTAKPDADKIKYRETYFAGIIICVIFWCLIRSYKQLNTAKFALIHEIEKHLPLALYKYEWKILGEGKDVSKYYPFSHIELAVPCFVVLLLASPGASVLS